MARPLRIEFAKALYHLTSRGDGREAIYLSDSDREQWLAVFSEVCRRFNRYIVLNPVRAGMVRSAKDWPWSSYRATAGLVTAYP